MIKKAYLFLICAFISLDFIQLRAQSEYTSSPSIGTNIGGSSNQTCGGFNVLGNTIQMKVKSINQSTGAITFTVSKVSGTFSSSGTLYLRSSLCSGDYQTYSYSSGVSSFNISYTPSGFTSGTKNFYAYSVSNQTTPTRTWAGSISVTATPITVSAPTNSSPTDGQTLGNTTTSTTLRWTRNNPTGSATYQVNVRDLTTNALLLNYQDVGDASSCTLSGLQSGHQYRWVVQATSNKNSNVTDQSNSTTFSVDNSPANIMLAGSASFSNTNMIVGQTYTYSVKVKNTGGTSWTGNFFVKQGLGSGYADELTFTNQTIAAGQTITLAGSYTPKTAGNNLNMTLYMTGSVSVPANGYANTQVVNILSPLGQPALVSPTNAQTYSTTPVSINYQWTKNNGAGVTYRLKVRDITTDAITGPIVFDQNIGDNSSWTPAISYSAGKTYRWAVIAERGTETNDSPAYTFTITNPANIMLAGSASFSNTNMIVGQTYTYSVKVKNTGGTSWTGNFFVKQGLGTGYADELSFTNQTIAPGQTITLTGDYIPKIAGNNLNMTLYMTGSVSVPANGYTNTQVVNILSPLGQPALVSPTNAQTYSTTPGSITYQWTKNNGAGVTYRLKVRDITTDAITGPIVFDQNIGDNSSWAPSISYSAGKTYRWVVIAERGAENNDSPAYTFTITNPANIMLAGSASFSNVNMIVGQTYTYSVKVKNTGGTSWTGNFFVKQGLGTGYADELSFTNQTIAPGQTIALTGNYIPKIAGNNLNMTLYMTGSVAVPANGYVNSQIVNIIAENTNLALASQMGYFNSAGVKVSTLNIGETYTFKATVKNDGNVSKSFAFFLKKAQGVTSVYDLTMSPYTIAPAQTVEISKTFTPSAAEQNVSLSLFYQVNGGTGSTLVTQGSNLNPITITILSSTVGNCDLSGVSTTSAYYNATADLCSRGILSGSSVDGAVNVSDNLKRAHLAKIAFQGLYKIKGRAIPSNLVSDYYPTVYADLNTRTTTNDYYYQAVKALLYLEYGDGISPFDRNKTNFNPDNFIARIDVLKVLLETFNIKPDMSSQTNPFPQDADAISLLANNPLKFAYLRKAVSLGIVTAPSGTSNINFRPFDNCVRGEAFVMLDRIIQKIDAGTIADPNPVTASYFVPLNITLENLAMGLSMQQGNFNHYTKSSFSIDGLVPLGFAHTYNSSSTELPDDFYCVNDLGKGKTETYKPLGTGWSHSYHTYATQVEDKLVIHWGGAQIDVYKANGATWTPMSVGLYDEATIANSILTVKTKSQIRYLFKRQSTSGPAILQLYSVVDRNGNTLTINYTAGQNGLMVISSISDGQRQLKFGYKSGTNLLEQITDPLNRSIRFGYTLNSILNEYQLTQFTDAKGQITNYTYGSSSDLNQCKLLQKIQLPKGNYIQNEYEANRRLSKTVTGVNGTPKTQTAISVNTNYQTSALSSKVDITRAGTTSSYNYSFNKNNSTTAISGSGNLNIAATYGNSTRPELPTAVQSNTTNVNDIQYDTKGNVIKITKKSMTNAETQTITMTYNSMNDVTSYTDPKGNVTNYTYDTNGNLIKIQAPESATTSLTINSKGLPTQSVSPEGITSAMGYNAYGNLNSIALQALNLSSSMTYDNASRLTSATDFKGLKTAYTYDSNDNVLTETNPMNYVTSYGYDANDNLQTITNAKGGVTTMGYDNATDWLTSVSFGGASKQYAYNVDGSLKTYTKPDGTALISTYDALGRVTSDGINTYTYDANLRLSTITKNGKTLTYTYDGFNRVTAVDYNDFANNKVQYGYDANGNITSITYPGGKVVTYTYDGLNRMKSVTDWNSKTISYIYRKDDLLQSVTYPNGMTTTFTYDAAGRQTAKTTNRSNNTVIAGYSFKLDSIGNITQETKNEPYQNVPLIAGTTNYAYNSANHIKTAGATSFSFDANGNTTQRGSSIFTWDDSDKITSGDGLTFEYDGLGNRRAAGSKRYMMDIMGMGNVLAECNANGTPTAYYIHGLGLEARILPNGTTEYYVSDYRGSTVAMVDASAIITHKYQYDEFGNITQQQETDVNPFRYVGKYGVMYENDHLVFMRARYYDPTIGRFMSEDPVWSANLYPYGDNNSINSIDPNGLTSIPIELIRSAVERYNYVAPQAKTVYNSAKIAIQSSKTSLDALKSSIEAGKLLKNIQPASSAAKAVTPTISSTSTGGTLASMSTGAVVGATVIAIAEIALVTATVAGVVQDYKIVFNSKNDDEAIRNLNKNGSWIWRGSQAIGNGIENFVGGFLKNSGNSK